MSAGTGARGPRRHASSSAALCTADVATPAVVPRPSSSRSARAPSSPPILASAVTASVWGGPCEVAGTERTSASRGATARDSFSRPSPKAAAAATPWFESPSASTRASTAAGSPIRPAASAAWRRTTGSGCRSASPNSAGSKARASAAASTRASSLTSASSGCCAAAPRPPSAAAPSRTTTLQADRIRDRLEEGEYMPGDSRHGVLMRQRDQRRLARGEQFAALGLVHRVTERHTSRGELAHPAAYPHEVVVPRGRAVAQLHLGDGEVDALPLELLVRQARFAHQLGAGPVEPDEVIGVVDHPHLIGLGVVDAERYRADHAGAKSASLREKSNTTGACGPFPWFLAWGRASPQLARARGRRRSSGPGRARRRGRSRAGGPPRIRGPRRRAHGAALEREADAPRHPTPLHDPGVPGAASRPGVLDRTQALGPARRQHA